MNHRTNAPQGPPLRQGRAPTRATERHLVGCRQCLLLCRPPCPGRRAREFCPSGSARGLMRTTTRMVAVFHGVWCSTTLAEAGSDLHRDCLPRLCCAFRFSQPLDALFRLRPVQPCFMPVTPLGLYFQRVPLPGSGHASRRDLPFLSLLATNSDVGQDDPKPAPTSRVFASEESVHGKPVLPGDCRPILS